MQVQECCGIAYCDTGTPTGRVEKLQSDTDSDLCIDAYFAGSPTDTVILLLCDSFGFTLINTRLEADRLAADTGLMVCVPDYLISPYMPEGVYDVEATQKKTVWEHVTTSVKLVVSLPALVAFAVKQKPNVLHERILLAMNVLVSKFGTKQFAVLGYCWGGRYSIALAAAAPNANQDLETSMPKHSHKIVAFAAAHPSSTQEKDIDALSQISDLRGEIHLADNDPFLSKKDANKWRSKLKNIPFYEYQNTRHGFATRGDESVPSVCEARKLVHTRLVALIKQERT